MSNDTRALENALYTALAPRMVLECEGCKGEGWWGELGLSQHSPCHSSGKVAPLVFKGVPFHDYRRGPNAVDAVGLNEVVPLALVLETAAAMGLEIELSYYKSGWEACCNESNKAEGKGVTSTLAVLRALEAALGVTP